MLLLSSILIGIHKMMSKLRLERIVLDRKMKFRSIALLLKILMRRKCLKGLHVNWDLIRLFSWVVNLKQLCSYSYKMVIFFFFFLINYILKFEFNNFFILLDYFYFFIIFIFLLFLFYEIIFIFLLFLFY